MNQPANTPPPANMDELWARLPDDNATLRGLKRGMLRTLAKRKLIQTANVRADGERGVVLIFLPSLDDYLARTFTAQNFGERPELRFLALLDAALPFDPNFSETVDRIAEILLGHPATCDEARLLLVRPIDAGRYLHILAKSHPKRVQAEPQTKGIWWTITRA